MILDNPDADRRHDWCQQIIAGVQGMLEYTEKARRIHEISGNDGPRHTRFDLTESINTVLADNPLVTNDIQLTTTFPDSASVAANHKLPLAIDELVTNAIEHNDTDEPAVAITVAPDRGPPATTQVIIEDNGPGIHSDTVEVLERAKEDKLLHLSGLGLWMVYWTVMESDGELQIETKENSGSRIVLTLPNAVELPGTSMSDVFGSANWS